METIISERGNGFPAAGDYVPGTDGNLYRVTATNGRIHTGDGSGAANYIYAEIEAADWDDTDSDDDVFQALAKIGEE